MSYSQSPAIDLPITVRVRTSRRRRRSSLRLTMALVTLAVVAGSVVVVESSGHRRRETGSPSSHHARASLPPAADLAVSRGLGADLAAYRLARSSRGFIARDIRQGITASFGARGATVTAHDGARASIALQAIRVGAALHPVGLAQPLARGNRVEYRRAGATEWFANGPAGIEQGFTIAREPAGAAHGALTLALGLSGTLTARPGSAGGLVLVGANGRAVLRYGELSVSDARGRSLPAHMTASMDGC